MAGEDSISIGGIKFRESQVKTTVTNGQGFYSVELDDGSVFTFNEQSVKQQARFPSIFRDETGRTHIENCVLNYLQDSPNKDYYVLSNTDVEGGGTIGKDDTLMIFDQPKHDPSEPMPMNRNFFSQHQ